MIITGLTIMPPNISVIISTYNKPEYLKLVVQSYREQSYGNFEIIVADDGSSDETKEVIKSISKNCKLDIKHVWQPDKGFRLAKIRNLAVKEAAGDYILFTDQDCISHPELLNDLVGNAAAGRVIQGSRRNISLKNSREIITDKIIDSKKLNALSRPFFSYVFNNFTLLHIGALTGCNLSLYKKDFELLNGFCEEYEGWGAEDFDLGFRAFMEGLKFKFLFKKAYVYHLYHPQTRNYLNRNYRLLYRKMLFERHSKI